MTTRFPRIASSEAIFPTKFSLSPRVKEAMTEVVTTPTEPKLATRVAGMNMYAKKLANSPVSK